jgi:hypothetical protein
MVAVFLLAATAVLAQTHRTNNSADQFGPNVRSYLEYLRQEEEVVDDRQSRPEIRRDYYLRNMNRIRALREVALKIARSSGNDYIPELEAVAPDELHTLFETPPELSKVKIGDVLNNTFRFMGKVRTGQTFFVFARLDPYEQAEFVEREKKRKTVDGVAGAVPSTAPTDEKPNQSP